MPELKMFETEPQKPALQLDAFLLDEFNPHRFEISVESAILDNRYIELRQKIHNQGYKLLIDTQEKMIREALIELGWTPPIE